MLIPTVIPRGKSVELQCDVTNAEHETFTANLFIGEHAAGVLGPVIYVDSRGRSYSWIRPDGYGFKMHGLFADWLYLNTGPSEYVEIYVNRKTGAWRGSNLQKPTSEGTCKRAEKK
jgi:hypothetical protein